MDAKCRFSIQAAIAAVAAGFIGTVAIAQADQPVQRIDLFATLAEAQLHCPGGGVIDIRLPEGFYLHGDRGFGGASLDRVYLCRGELARVESLAH